MKRSQRIATDEA